MPLEGYLGPWMTGYVTKHVTTERARIFWLVGGWTKTKVRVNAALLFAVVLLY